MSKEHKAVSKTTRKVIINMEMAEKILTKDEMKQLKQTIETLEREDKYVKH